MVISSRARVSPKGRYMQCQLSDNFGTIEISFFDNDLLTTADELFKQNIPLVNEKFSKATILSNIYYRLQKPEKNKFTLTVKNYGA